MGKYMEETNKTVRENTEKVISLRDDILANYVDLLEKKRPELVNLLRQIDPVSVRTVDFRVPTWRSSWRLQ